MRSIRNWWGAALVLALGASAAQAQNPYFQVRPGLTPQQYNQAGGAYSPYAVGFGAYTGLQAGGNMYSSPYGGGASITNNPYGAGGYSPYYPGGYYGNPYLPPFNYDPLGGYLRGSADLIDAQKNFMLSIEQAHLAREAVRAERMANRRRAFDDYLYYREKTPTLEQERERGLAQQRDRSRNDPPITEIWSGQALNDILGELRALKAKGQIVPGRVPAMPLDADTLRQINVTGKEGGNIGLLKNEGRLTWPVALTAEETKKERDRIGELTQSAIEQAKFKNTVDAGTLKQLATDVERLHKVLSKNVGDLPTAQYIEARRFLNNLDDALKVLGGTNAQNYVTGKWSAKGKNVADLVQHMLDSGLLFAPAVAGEEAAYVALHRALATFDTALQNQVATEQPR